MKPIYKSIFFFIYSSIAFLIVAPLLVSGQNPIGWPDIVHYEKNDYSAGTQNWDIQQDRNGVLYFANNEGLLTFDGTYWKIYPLPNRTIVRSLSIAADNKIYVGGQGDFGYFSPGDNGQLQFHSLIDKIPAPYKSFADIWDITSAGNEVFFRSEKRIFKFFENRISVYDSASEWTFLGQANNTVIAQDAAKGLLAFKNNEWVSFLKEPLPAHIQVTSVSHYKKDTILVSSWLNGLFTIHNGSISRLNHYNSAHYASEQIAKAFKLTSDLLVIATNTNGCYILNRDGSLVYNFSRKFGLQNNSVLSVLKDNNNNLWLGLNNGIDFIATNNAVRHINPEIFNEGVGHYSLAHKSNLYVGLSGAVFRLPLSGSADISILKDDFSFVENSGGQAWGMNLVNDRLLLGKHEGAFEIEGQRTVPISGKKGYWNFLPFTHNQVSYVLAGNYNGIDIFDYTNGSFISKGLIKNFTESARFINIDKNNIVWASHPYKGVYKINLNTLENPDIKLYTRENGLPSTFNNHVYKVKDRIVVCTEKGVYEYNQLTDSFELSPFFKDFFGNRYVRYLKEDKEGNVWFIQEKNLGVFDFSKQEPALIYIPELNGKVVSGFEHINPIDKNNVLVGAQKGFYHINYEKYMQVPDSPNVHINLVKAIGKRDSLLFGGYYSEINEVQAQKEIPNIAFNLNSFHFEYAAILHRNQSDIEYSYYLEGFDEQWSVFSRRTEKDYTNLPYGDYVFKVKARNNFGKESAVTSFSFTILPPWYQTIIAYLIYAFLFIYLIYYIYRKQKEKFLKQKIAFQKEQDRIKYLHQLEVDRSEKEIIKLKNEKLQMEIEVKNSELASTSMHLVQKNDLLSKIKSDLSRLNTSDSSDDRVYDIKKIIRLLKSEEKTDEGWDQFSIHFDKIHTNFLEDLKQEFPRITNNDLKLATYLKLGLSTKEIAELMKISPRGVEISRYRLRKKLHIPSDVSFFDFFNNFKKVH